MRKVLKLKVFRVMCGKTQKELAAEVGLTQEYISMIETTRAIPAKKTRTKIAAAVGADDPERLFDEEV